MIRSFDINFALLMPEFLLAGLAVLVVGVEFLIPHRRKNFVAAGVTALGLVCILAFTLLYLWGKDDLLYDGLYRIDHYSLLFKTLFMCIGVIVALMSVSYLERRMQHAGEYYGLLVLSVLGATMMAASGELLTAYISLELLSFSLYVMVSLTRGDSRSAEAGVKYILLGALSSAIMLYGISILYGTLESTSFRVLALPLSANIDSPTVIVGLTMVLAGLGFKMAMVPFHLWAPDVYEGAPTPVTAHLAVLSKAAAFALVLRFFAESLFLSLESWQLTLAFLAAITMTLGNLVALVQRNVKRLLAYSSIAQVGYLLMGVVALTHESSSALILHLVGYSFTNLAIFTVVIIVELKSGNEGVQDFAGLGDRSPFIALVMSAALFSLAGLPFLAGFATKFVLFTSTASAGLLWLAGVAIINSLISLYYYLNIVRQMYIEEPKDHSAVIVSPFTTGLTFLLLAGIVLVGVFPGPILDLIDVANRSLSPFFLNS